jgi:hypothetical protein
MRTWRAQTIRLPMGLGSASESVAFNRTGKALAFAGAHHIDMIADGKNIDCQLIPFFYTLHCLYAKFAQVFEGR